MRVFDDPEKVAGYDNGAQNVMFGFDALYEICLAVLDGRAMKRLLVLGAGTGKETVMLKKRHSELDVVAVDPSAAMLEIARKKLQDEGLQADVRHGFLEDFDDLRDLEAVLMIGVLHHLSDKAEQQTMISQLGQRIRSGGLLIFGCQVGPMGDPLRRGALEQRARDRGMSEEEILVNRSRFASIVALEAEQLGEWLGEAGFQHRERIFSTLFFEVWACVRS